MFDYVLSISKLEFVDDPRETKNMKNVKSYKTYKNYAKACLILASKFYEIQFPSIMDVFNKLEIQEYLILESEILEKVDFKVCFPNHWSLVTLFEHIFFEENVFREKLFAIFKKSITN